MARKHTRMVIAYDFDGTLAPGNMQEYDFVPALKMQPAEFWAEAQKVAQEQQADAILAYMQVMLKKATAAEIPVRKEGFLEFGAKIRFFPGVEDWFERMNEYARQKHVRLEHYIISSGLREMVEGTRIAKHFTRIYASGFMYDHNGVANWPALAVNYTTKTQYLFRINKGSLDVYDNTLINKYVPDEARPVPFANMIFIGDGETDIPCMRLVKDHGGHSIAVYDPDNKQRNPTLKEKARQLIEDGRATLATKADYRPDSPIDHAVRAMIDKVAANALIHDCAD
ncbi:MAG: HAD family hydrolase [Formivibrio sp.]|nr:HAD family hydrolase [Formivibrio sp.]